MPRPRPTLLYHFTHVSNLPTMAERGLFCDADAAGLLPIEVGQRTIKEQRRRRRVGVGPGGVVADYVPFYFAPRSPMLSAIVHGQVPGYAEGQDPIVYLVTSVERLVELSLALLFTDRNAALAFARLTDDLAALDDLVDWPLMRATYWFNTSVDPDRRERRMAECLVHRRVPWEAVIGVAAGTAERQAEAAAALGVAGIAKPVTKRPGWYFRTEGGKWR